MTVEQHVQAGADKMAKAEKAAGEIGKHLAAVSAVIVKVHGEGVDDFGYLESRELASEAKALAGLAANLEMELFSFHRKLTGRCQELGIDLPAPGGIMPRSGGGGGR